MRYDDHPLAAIFPLMTEGELQELANDIGDRGLRDDIWLYEGKVLDGRNRYRACDLADAEPRFCEYTGSDPLGFVISKNLHRRHLTESQRAMVAANIANARHGGDRKTDQAANLPLDIPQVSQAKAAEQLQVGERSVRAAAAVKRDGVPELVAAVEAGEVSVSAAAEVAKLPKKEQKKAVRGGADAVKAAAKNAKGKPEPVSQPAEAEPGEVEEVTPGPDGDAEPEPDPADEFVAAVEAVCRDLDQVGARIRGLKASPYSYAVHWQAAADQVKAARSALWNGRPLYKCPYCNANGQVDEDCRACRGTNRVYKGTYDRGVAAVGGGDE